MTQEHRSIEMEGTNKAFYKAQVYCRNCRFEGEMDIQFGKSVGDGICTNCGCKQIQHADQPRNPVPILGTLGKGVVDGLTWPAIIHKEMEWDLTPDERKHVMDQLHRKGAISNTTFAEEQRRLMEEQAFMQQQMNATLPAAQTPATVEAIDHNMRTIINSLGVPQDVMNGTSTGPQGAKGPVGLSGSPGSLFRRTIP